ncbi:DsbA family protein [Leptolyngbya sp. AN03gr2]|uniref:DsbA family protein n=1 Tax=unclassified Leptolyngbya TaxID=2650499 RepID=UPI003D310AE6
MSTPPHSPSLFVLRPCDHVQGDAGAAVTLIHYGCYTCPLCATLHLILSDLLLDFESQLRVVFRHFPTPDPTEQSLHAAEAAEAASAQGKFWQMHNLLLTHQDALGDGELVEYAIAIQLNIPQFLREMRQDVHVERVSSDLESGLQLGVDQVPAVFINGHRYRGDWNFDALSAEIKAVLKQSQLI